MKRILIALTTMTVALVTLQAPAQIQKGKTRPLETKTWMKTVNGPQCTALAKVLKEGPADDAAWTSVTGYAQMLNEAGHVLMADSRCPDKVWADATQQLREGSEAILQAASAKNTEMARKALNESVLAACKACHTVHRKK
jgi:cytochrome c556